MVNHSHESAPDFTAVLAENIAQAVSHHTRSPEFRSELIGEIMTHTGHCLIQSAANYLTIQPEDLLVKPEPVADSGDAVLLTKTISRTANSYAAIVNVVPDGDELTFNCTYFISNELNTIETKFIKIPEAHQAEVNRQLKAICKNAGTLMLNVSVIPGYFKKAEDAAAPLADASEPAMEEPAPIDAEQSKRTAMEQALAAEAGLPPPDENLL